MAEFVQLRKEKWTDPLNFLRKLKLFKSSELREVVANVENYEYKIQSPNRKLDDVLAYISYECKLLKALQKRRHTADQYEGTDEIDKFIYDEIYTQFGSAEITFQHDIKYWNARLKFIATIVPPQNREVEFNRIFRKALDYCGRGHLELYQYCANFCWTFPSLHDNVNGKRKSKKRKKLMKEGNHIVRIQNLIREITNEALRNFTKSPEAWIWVTTTELKYLSNLQDEENLTTDIAEEETDKAEAMIKLLSDTYFKTFKDPKSLFLYFDAVKEFGDLPQAENLSKQILNEILSIQPRTSEIFAWLIGKAIGNKKIDECLERIEQALSSSLPKITVLHICLEKLDLNVIYELFKNVNGEFYYWKMKLIEFFCKLLDKDNSEWSQVQSDMYHVTRIKFLKMLPAFKLMIDDDKRPTSVPAKDHEQILKKISSFEENNPFKATLLASVTKFPTNLFLVKERIAEILSQNSKSIKPELICRYLKDLDLRRLMLDKEKSDETRQFLLSIYHSFMSLKIKSSKWEIGMAKLLKIKGTDEMRAIHLKTMYILSVEEGREFYEKYREFATDWKFAITAVRAETIMCKDVSSSQRVLDLAISDAMTRAKDTATEPWKVCISSLFELRKNDRAVQLLQRALSLFSGEAQKDLLMFSQSLKE